MSPMGLTLARLRRAPLPSSAGRARSCHQWFCLTNLQGWLEGGAGFWGGDN